MNGRHLILGIEGPELSAHERETFERLQPAGYILFTRNIVGPRQTRALTDSLRELSLHEPIIAIDQEGGRVTRTDAIAPAAPSAPELAALGEVPKIIEAATLTADLMRLLGINLDFAPVLDLDHFPGRRNALSGRSWGRDPQRVIDFAGNWNRWLRNRSLRSCAKHFPAGGRAVSDPHFDLPSSPATKSELLAEDIIPYTALMPELDAIMLAHVRFPELDPELPASLSRAVVTGFLRDQLGFDRHLVITDDLDMGAVAGMFPEGRDVTAALKAGSDLALICHRVDRAEQAAARASEIDPWLLADSEKRLLRFHKRLHGPLVWSDDHWQQSCDKLTELRAAVPRLESSQASSPVADY